MAVTKRQREILDWITAFIDEHRYSPSYAEVGAGTGIRSLSTVSGHVKALAERGFITVQYNRNRSIDVVKR